MNEGPIILIFIRHYLPGYKSGGPVRTVENMVEQLGDELKFWIITSDRDALDSNPFETVRIDKWNQVGKAMVFYASPVHKSFKGIIRLMRETPYDVIYLNSFFDYKFTILPLLARLLRFVPNSAVVLAPRGEFSEGALSLKAWKKKLFITLSSLGRLYGDITWHVSCSNEVYDIKQTLGHIVQKLIVAPDLPPLVKISKRDEHLKERTNDSLRVVLLSRISPMKNLDYALEVMSLVSIPVEFNIYGPLDDNAYWNKCRNLIEKLPLNIMACYHGQIKHENVLDLLSTQDLFFLPTRGESYGHVVFEALAAGLPVLISDQTPWRNLEEAGVGWTLPLSLKTGFVEVIEKQATLTPVEREEQRLRSQAYAVKATMDKEALRLNLALFKDLLT